MEKEFIDRFGPLPDVAQNLMYQLRLKALARDAGVGAIAVENGRLALRSGGAEFDREGLRRLLNGRASVSRHGVWLENEPGWRNKLMEVLREMADAAVG
jgi:transcription-repair coupling factor (superfamily II helicase)